MFATEENKLRVFILAILFASIAIVLLYHRSVLNAGLESESEQLLFYIGKSYESEIKSEFSRFESISDLLSKTVSKNYDNQNFNQEINEIFRDLIYRNARLQSIELVLKEPEMQIDSSILFVNLIDSLKKNSIRLYKSKNGILEDNAGHEFESDNLRIAVEKATIVDQTLILAPENVLNEGKASTVVPILSSIYKGKQFLGYIMLNISVNWMSQPNYNYSQILEFAEVFISSPDGKVIALNKNKDLIAEPIEKTCISCKDLLGNKGQDYNTGILDGYLTVCTPWQPTEGEGYWNICVRTSESEMSGYLHSNAPYSLLIALVVLFLAASSIILLLKKYTLIWSGLDNFAQQILNGGQDLIDESGESTLKSKSTGLNVALLNIAKSLDKLAKMNNAAMQGDFDMVIESEFKNHKAYKSSKELQLSFKSKIDNLTIENDNLKQFKLLTEGLERINKVLKQHHTDLTKLSINVIHSLVDLLEIEMGALFLMKSDNSQPYLELIVSYAYSENRFQKRKFNLGESLVGACASEKRTIYLKKVPEDYLKIISGLGMASPKSILIVPLIFENTVLGVIELGSLKDFNENKISFSERAAETIANTLSMAEINIKTSELLEQTNKQTIELEKRDKLMIQALDDLKQLQNKTALSEASIRAKLEAMNNTLMMVEYTSRGILLDANFKYLNTMNFAIEDIKGIDVLELLKENEKAELIKIINTVKNGNFYEGIIRRHTRHGDEKWLMATYTPVYGENNIVESILFFATDITRMRKNETQLKQKVQELTLQVEELRKLLNK
jgi:PAS domain S-box-containing protein